MKKEKEKKRILAAVSKIVAHLRMMKSIEDYELMSYLIFLLYKIFLFA